jgi:hypothetical protein
VGALDECRRTGLQLAEEVFKLAVEECIQEEFVIGQGIEYTPEDFRNMGGQEVLRFLNLFQS